MYAQNENLIPNPGFEEFDFADSPINKVTWEGCVKWYSPTLGSPDYWNKKMLKFEEWKGTHPPYIR